MYIYIGIYGCFWSSGEAQVIAHLAPATQGVDYFVYYRQILHIILHIFLLKVIYIPRGSKVWTICMHLGMHALRASDHAICGLTMIFACMSDSLFSDWFPINSDSLWGIAADLVTVCHGVFRQCPRFKYSFLSLSRFVTVCHATC